MLWWDPIEGTKPNNKLLQEFLDDFDIIECIFLSQGWHYDSFPVFTIYKLQNVSPYCLIKQVNKILGIGNSEIWLFDDVIYEKTRSKVLRS